MKTKQAARARKADPDAPPNGYDLFERSVIAKVGEVAFDAWINDGMSECVEDWFKKWMNKLGGSEFNRAQLTTYIAVEAVEAFKVGVNLGIDRARQAIDEAEL